MDSRSLGQRLAVALDASGKWITDLQHLDTLESRVQSLWLEHRERGRPSEWQLLLSIASILNVDPRWLITGKSHRLQHDLAAPLEQQMIDQKIDPAMQQRMFFLLALLPEPSRGPGRCRYCLTQGGIIMVDDDLTICRTCLGPKL